MKLSRVLLAAACAAVLPAAASAATFTASLSADAVVPNAGPAGATGLATISVDGTTVSYNLLFSGVDNPTQAHIHSGAAGATGGVVVDLEPTFSGGSAFGSVAADQDTIDAILGDPAGYYVQVHSEGFAAGALRGQLNGGGSGEQGTVLYHPVVANVPGLAGTSFVTDVRILNHSGDTATVTIDYYAEGAGGHSSPTHSTTITVADDEQLVADDVVQSVFGATNTKGGVVITSDRQISAAARIYNDQRAAGDGTFGQYQPGLELSHGWAAGTVLFLSNDDPATGEGFRSNLGWFNPNPSAVNVTFDAYDTSGFLIGQTTMTVGPYEQRQMNIGTLFPALSTYGDCYISYTTGGGEHVFVYGSVVDNVNGDAVYVAATP
jgi:hypothetical protein